MRTGCILLRTRQESIFHHIHSCIHNVNWHRTGGDHSLLGAHFRRLTSSESEQCVYSQGGQGPWVTVYDRGGVCPYATDSILVLDLADPFYFLRLRFNQDLWIYGSETCRLIINSGRRPGAVGALIISFYFLVNLYVLSISFAWEQLTDIYTDLVDL